ncbi:MAG: ribonuclease HI family protein [Nitrospirae bacterium]|nr:ribonuclease HI family protein [Nitrospirota bacterium]
MSDKQCQLFNNNFQPDFPDNFDAEIYCDGASSGNPGNSGIGVIIRHKPVQSSPRPRPDASGRGGQFTVRRISEYIGTATNNTAEYRALIRGLKEASALGFKKIKVFLDSELLVKQITGIYKVKNNNLKHLWSEVQDILREFGAYEINHNKEFLKGIRDNTPDPACCQPSDSGT